MYGMSAPHSRTPISIDTVDYCIRIIRSEVDRMVITVKIVAAILAAILNLSLIIFVSTRYRRHIAYRSFLLICFCLLMWNLRVIISGLVQLESSNSLYALLVTQVFYPMVSACLYILPVAALQFTISFIGFESRLSEYLLRTAYVISLILSFLYVSEIFSNWTNDRIFWSFFLPIFFISAALVGQAYFRSRRPLERARFSLLVIAGTIGVAGAITEDILVASGVKAGGLGNIANATYSLLIAICLFRHRLFDVSLTARRITSFLITSLVVISIAYITSYFVGQSTAMPYIHIFIAVLLLLLFGRTLIPLTEKIVFKKSAPVYQTIDSVRLSLDRAQNIPELLQLSEEIAKENLGVGQCRSILFEDTTHCHQFYRSLDDEELNDRQEPLYNVIKWVDAQRSVEPVIYDELTHTVNFGAHDRTHNKELLATVADIEKTGFEVFLPLLSDRKLEGVMMLSEKKNGRAFTDSDVRFMKLLAYNCTTWLHRFRMLERIGQLEAFAALGEMAAYLAHELKNPLTIIRSSAQLMESDQHDRQNVHMIVRECDRLSRVVMDMLNFAKTPSPVSQRIDIRKETKRWIDEISHARGSAGLKIRIDAEEKVTDVIFDPNHLKQIITNVVLNAIEAMRERGRLTIALKDEKEMVQLTVSDSGPGIRYHDRPKVFSLFYSTKSGGSGLGLPLSRRLMELNKGTLEIDSQVKEGCTVIMRLPKWKEES